MHGDTPHHRSIQSQRLDLSLFTREKVKCFHPPKLNVFSLSGCRICLCTLTSVNKRQQHQQHKRHHPQSGSGCDIISFTKVLSRVKFRFAEKLLRGEVIMRRIFFRHTLSTLAFLCLHFTSSIVFAFRWHRRLHANERES